MGTIFCFSWIRVDTLLSFVISKLNLFCFHRFALDAHAA